MKCSNPKCNRLLLRTIQEVSTVPCLECSVHAKEAGRIRGEAQPHQEGRMNISPVLVQCESRHDFEMREDAGDMCGRCEAEARRQEVFSKTSLDSRSGSPKLD